MKKKLAAMLALLSATAIAVTACGKPSDATVGDSASGVSEGTSLGSLDDKTVIAKLADESLVTTPEDFRVTLSDFNKEYKFRLLYMGVDETDEANADTCAEYRSSIIDYLTLEKISLYKAAEAGFTGATLTDEELSSITTSAESTISSYKTSYAEDAKAALGDSYSEEQLDAKEGELLDNFLAECGYTTEIFYEWAKIDMLQTKLVEKLVADVTVTAEEVDEFYLAAQEEAKNVYETDIATFEGSSGYSVVYVPEGSRNIRHIYLPFDTTAATEIATKRSEGDTAGADALRDTAYESVRATAETILNMLDIGGDFSEIQTVYNQDPNGKHDYVVIPGTTAWAEAYSTAAFAMEKIGDHSGIVVADDGVYILNYASDAELSEETVTSLKSYAESSLLQQKQNNTANEMILQWQADYPFDVDYAALDITVADDAENLDASETSEATPAA